MKSHLKEEVSARLDIIDTKQGKNMSCKSQQRQLVGWTPFLTPTAYVTRHAIVGIVSLYTNKGCDQVPDSTIEFDIIPDPQPSDKDVKASDEDVKVKAFALRCLTELYSKPSTKVYVLGDTKSIRAALEVRVSTQYC